ncbi:MAG TPA: hypothetical protein VHI13_17935 [Candidatus Kapabacteria bacterium]|nr:hypothetical protein [Candidatus Kapabacteria bacterium]
MTAALAMSGCFFSVESGIRAEYPDNTSMREYRSFPYLLATNMSPAGSGAVRLRRLLDSLGLEDVGSKYLSGDAATSMRIVRRRDGKPFDRLHAPELLALRTQSDYHYGPIVRISRGRDIGIFATSFSVVFKSSVTPDACRSAVRMLTPAGFEVDEHNPRRYGVSFGKDIGEGIVDKARILTDAGIVETISLEIFEDVTPRF